MESYLVDNGSNKNRIVKLWLECLINLNNEITNYNNYSL